MVGETNLIHLCPDLKGVHPTLQGLFGTRTGPDIASTEPSQAFLQGLGPELESAGGRTEDLRPCRVGHRRIPPTSMKHQVAPEGLKIRVFHEPPPAIFKEPDPGLL